MQSILLRLISMSVGTPNSLSGDEITPLTISTLSPQIDNRAGALFGDRFETLEQQMHRRVIKTHLPIDGLPFYPEVHYVVVARDPRDVFMSQWNHYSSFTDGFYSMVNKIPNRFGDELPRCPSDLHEFWRLWICRGWFEWEMEGYPFGGNMRHTQTWWDFRHLDNVLMIHFDDLLADIAGQLEKISSFVNVTLSQAALTEVAESVNFLNVSQAPELDHPTWELRLKGGGRSFYFSGRNGRWRGVLSDMELNQYETTKDKVLSEDCAKWLQKRG